MAAFYVTRTTYDSHAFFGRIGSYLVSAIESVVDWNDARVTRNALAGLTDRELEDIGLVRGDIDLVAEGRRQR